LGQDLFWWLQYGALKKPCGLWVLGNWLNFYLIFSGISPEITNLYEGKLKGKNLVFIEFS
jgi:hypothetical protein